MEKSDQINEESQTVGQRIIALRTHLNIKQTDFANSIGVSHSFMSQVESGKNLPGYLPLKNIFLKYNVNPEYLFTGQGPMFKEAKESSNHYGELNDQIHDMLKDMMKFPIIKLSVLQFYHNFIFANQQLIEFNYEREIEKRKKEQE